MTSQVFNIGGMNVNGMSNIGGSVNLGSTKHAKLEELAGDESVTITVSTTEACEGKKVVVVVPEGTEVQYK